MAAIRENTQRTASRIQNRTVALIENGSWAPQPVKVIKGLLEGCKNIAVLEPAITIKSALTQENLAQIAALADLLSADVQ